MRGIKDNLGRMIDQRMPEGRQCNTYYAIQVDVFRMRLTRIAFTVQNSQNLSRKHDWHLYAYFRTSRRRAVLPHVTHSFMRSVLV